jgi:hypothetical protein
VACAVKAWAENGPVQSPRDRSAGSEAAARQSLNVQLGRSTACRNSFGPPTRKVFMPEKRTIVRARKDARRGKSPGTQAGEFVREEVHHIRKGKHGARSAKQAIAIGLSKARRAGVPLRPPARGRVSEKTRRSAVSAYRAGRRGSRPSARRSRATLNALRREGRRAASRPALARQARLSARRRSMRSRSAAARRAAQTRSQRRWR